MLSQSGYYFKGKEKIVNLIINDILASKKRKFKLIDVGCGDGYFLRTLYKALESKKEFDLNSINLIGIDRYKGYEKYFKTKNIVFQLDDIFKIHKIYGDNCFDFVVCSEVLEHVVETDDLIKKIKKILKPDGILYLTTPNLASYHGRLSLLLGYTPLIYEVSNEYAAFGKGFLDRLYSKNATGEPVYHVRVFTYKALKEFIIYHGFEIISIKGFGYKIPWFWEKIPSLSSVIYVACKKK